MRKQIALLALLSTLVITSCNNTPKPPIIETRGGTYRYQIQPATTNAKIGTNIFVKIRNADSTKLSSNAQITVTGPSTWNGDKPLSFTYPTGAAWVISPQKDIPPVAGEYNVSVKTISSNGEAVVTKDKFTMTDATSIMEFPAIQITSADRDKVIGSWNAVTQANSYFTHLYNGTDAKNESKIIYTTQTTATFPENAGETIDLNPAKFNLMVVYSTNFDTTLDEPSLPSQVIISDAADFLNLQVTTAKQPQLQVVRIPKVFYR